MTQEETQQTRRPVDGPYLRAAFICERILEEKDGVKTPVRMIDRIQVQASGPDAPTTMLVGLAQFLFYASFIQGEARGGIEIEIKLEPPSIVDVKRLWAGTLDFSGGVEQGHDLQVNVAMSVSQPGLYWIDIYVEGVRFTRTPLRVSYVRSLSQR